MYTHFALALVCEICIFKYLRAQVNLHCKVAFHHPKPNRDIRVPYTVL
jgi:hypothetical protein